MNTIYYPPYDVFIDSETGKINLPICKCTGEDKCFFLTNWINDGKPTHVPMEEIERLKGKQIEEDESIKNYLSNKRNKEN